MNNYGLEGILQGLNRDLPPSDIAYIKALAEIGWRDIPDEDVYLCSDVIIRIRVDCIMIENAERTSEFDEYRNLMMKIKKNVRISGFVDRSSDFKIYFDDFCECLSGL